MRNLTKKDLKVEHKELLDNIGLALEYFPSFDHSTARLRSLPIHSHNFLEMFYIINGRCENIFGNDNIYIEDPGSLVIVNYGQSHVVHTPFGPVEKMNIYIDLKHLSIPTVPPEFENVLPVVLPLHHSLKHNLSNVVHLRFENHEKITSILKFLHEELQNRTPGYQDIADNYFRTFLLETCRTIKKNGIVRGFQNQLIEHDPVERIRHYMDSHFTENLTLAQLANMAKMNQTYFGRKFKKYTDKTPFEYILHRRIERAMVLLRAPHDKILSICMKSGFNDISFFNHTFKKIVGLTPGEYRKQWLSASNRQHD